MQANILAANGTAEAVNQVYNISVGERTTLNELFRLLQEGLGVDGRDLPKAEPVYREFRPGDVRHSLADIGKAKALLGYEPTHRIKQGLACALDWYRSNAASQRSLNR